VLCGAADGIELQPIEDFELGAAGGGWYTNNDVCEDCQPIIDELDEVQTRLSLAPADAQALSQRQEILATLAACRTACQATQTPTIFDKPLPADRIPNGGRCGSRYALHTHTLQPLSGWGGNLGLSFTPPADASQWTGLAFWARIGPGSRNAVRVELVDKNTDQKLLNPDGEPVCLPNVGPDDLSQGCDKFGAWAVMDHDWRLFLLPFSQLRQAGWGKRAPSLEVGALRGLSFTFGPGSWDLWIDDVALYRR
jgi:hypothetical protein